MDSPSVESTSAPVLTPQSTRSSTTHFLGMPTSPQLDRLQDIPVPSIESHTAGLSELSGVEVPRLLAFPNSFDSVVDSLKQVNLNPAGDNSRLYKFGQENGSFTFTFRGLHNTTPEPSVRPEPSARPNYTFASGSRLSPGDILPVTSPSVAQGTSAVNSEGVSSSHINNIRASSAPVQAVDLALPPKPAKYDINDEVPPDEPYFNGEFQRAVRTGKSVAKRIAEILNTCDLAQDRDSHVFSMIQTANELREFDAPSVCTIGIVGDSGVGKSSLINSLLDETELATTAGLGAACTSVVTEFRLKKREHTSKYTIELIIMTDKEIEEQLRELLWSYRYFHISDLHDGGMTADEQKRLEYRSKLAWDTLQAAFGTRKELTELYLKNTSPGAEERIWQQLRAWTNELQWPGGLDNSGWLGSANTVEECNMKTQQIVKGNLWPFIKVVRIFLSSQVLKSGVILSDLPGFHDSNNARVKAAEDYMYGCDEIFVVADIGRAGTNKNVGAIFKKSLGNNLRNGRPLQGIALVCTKSEDLDVEEISKKFFTGSSNVTSARVRLLEKRVEDAEADDGVAGALRERDAAQDELDYIFMTARNDYIEKLIQDTHAKLFSHRHLSVFCVSNKMYKKNRKRVRVHDLPIKGSGIPALRNHCHKIPAQAQFRIAHHFLTVKLKGLVETVHLWLEGGSQDTLPNDSTVQRMLRTLQSDLRKNASDYIFAAGETQKQISEQVMIQQITASLENWTQDALGVCNSWWAKYHNTQIAGFCRNYGSWASPKVDYTEWNLELIESMVDAMSLWWDNYAERLTYILKELQHKILGALDSLASQVNDFHGAPMFAEALRTKVDSVVYSFAEAENFGKAKLESIKRDATQNHQSGYIYQVMYSTYNDCSIDSGTDVTVRRLGRLRQAIGSTRDPLLFKAIRSRLQGALSELASDTTRTLDTHIREILEQIGNDIELLRGSEAKILAQNGDFLERLRVVVNEIMVKMEAIGNDAAKAKAEAEAYHKPDYTG